MWFRFYSALVLTGGLDLKPSHMERSELLGISSTGGHKGNKFLSWLRDGGFLVRAEVVGVAPGSYLGQLPD